MGRRLQNLVVVPCSFGKVTQIVQKTLYFTGKLCGIQNSPPQPNISTQTSTPRHIRAYAGRRLQNVVVVSYPFGKVTKIVVQTLNFTGKLQEIKNSPRQPKRQFFCLLSLPHIMPGIRIFLLLLNHHSHHRSLPPLQLCNARCSLQPPQPPFVASTTSPNGPPTLQIGRSRDSFCTYLPAQLKQKRDQRELFRRVC
jgi:hypothetical protein